MEAFLEEPVVLFKFSPDRTEPSVYESKRHFLLIVQVQKVSWFKFRNQQINDILIIFLLAFLVFSCAQMFSVSKVTLLVILRWLVVLMLN